MYFKYVFQLLVFQLLHNTGDKSYQISCPNLSPIEAIDGMQKRGCTFQLGVLLFLPHRNFSTKVLRELIKCSCKAGCKGRCSCSKNGLPCTPLCKCYGRDCANTIIIREDNRDSKLDDD